MRCVLLAGVALVATQPFTPALAQSTAQPESEPQPRDIVVTGHVARTEAASSKTDVPLLETPQAISILPEQLLEDQGVRRLGEALFNVAGVSRSNVYGFFDGFKIRGFEASSGATYLDGLLDDTGSGTAEITALERVEVVKGPASGLFGQGPLSGIVNLVSKRPKADPFVNVSVAGGSYNLAELQLDANAALTRDGTLLARVAAVYRDQDFFVDYSGQRRIFIAPSLTWKVGPQTTLTALGRVVDDRINPWSPTTAYGTALPNPNGELPLSLSVNDGAYPAVQNNDYWSLGYVFEHRFDETVAVRQSVRYQDFHNNWDHWLFVSGISADFRTIDRFYYGPFEENGTYIRADTNASVRASTGPVDHAILFGIDYGRRRLANSNLFDVGPYPLDLYDPVYGTVSGPNPAVPGTTSRTLTTQRGFYVQDHMKLGALAITLGGRWDRATSAITDNGIPNGEVVDTAFSPRAGATLAISDAVSLYANYAKSFFPQGTYRASDGSTLPPERGINYEAGIKAQRADGRLTAMATLFDLTRANVATADLSPEAPPNTYVVTGEQRTRGIELEMAWRPVAGLELTGAYSLLDAKVTADSRLLVGARLSSVPRHVANLWARYTIQQGPLADFGFGAGVHHEGNRPASTASQTASIFYLDDYTLADAAIFYLIGKWTAQANVRNLFNERYFPLASLTRTTPGEPRTFIISLSRSF